ncbi:MAG: FliA/WhiG family RNA polymerase sigma factor [Deltaproteobacteria bacterium]|nr:FliA/WhiG family RNA polymerase sigma factor [Deltaproteobacteria bacterium]
MNEASLPQVNSAMVRDKIPGITDPGRQEEMVRQYAPLIRYIASRLALRLPSHISQEDLFSAGIIGLMDAIKKFDPDKNIHFKTYAEFRIKGAMMDELRSMDWVPRSVRKKTHMLERAYAEIQRRLERPAESEEVAQVLGMELEEFYQLLDETKMVSLVGLERPRKAVCSGSEVGEQDLLEILQAEEARDSFFSVHFAELQGILMQGIEALPDKEKLLISLYYYEELTMKEIGQIMGYTESRISQLHSQAMCRLRHKLRDYFHTLDD